MSSIYYKTTFIVIIFSGVIFYGFISLGYFPIAVVNSKFITQSQYEKTVLATANYYTVATKNQNNENGLESQGGKVELKRFALEQMIENLLIHEEAKKQFGEHLESSVAEKVKIISEGDNFKKAATDAYGLEFQELNGLFLRPIAERELLSDRFVFKNLDFQDWLQKEKTSARVLVLISNFSWNGQEIELEK